MKVELLVKACSGNIIVSLETECGKAFIATLLIREFTNKLVNGDGKKAIFVVDKGLSLTIFLS